MAAEKKYYTKEHQWIKFKDGNAVVGMTAYGLKDLGNLVLVDLPSENEEVTEGDEIAYLEGAKNTLSVYAPFEGVVIEINEDLLDRPELLNHDADTTYIAIIASDEGFDRSELLTGDEYEAYIRR